MNDDLMVARGAATTGARGLRWALGLAGLVALSTAGAAEIANVPDSMRARLSTSSAGLTEQFGVTGRLVRLQGRFQTVSVMRAGSGGAPQVSCLEPGPASVDALARIEAAPAAEPAPR